MVVQSVLPNLLNVIQVVNVATASTMRPPPPAVALESGRKGQ